MHQRNINNKLLIYTMKVLTHARVDFAQFIRLYLNLIKIYLIMVFVSLMPGCVVALNASFPL